MMKDINPVARIIMDEVLTLSEQERVGLIEWIWGTFSSPIQPVVMEELDEETRTMLLDRITTIERDPTTSTGSPQRKR